MGKNAPFSSSVGRASDFILPSFLQNLKTTVWIPHFEHSFGYSSLSTGLTLISHFTLKNCSESFIETVRMDDRQKDERTTDTSTVVHEFT